MIDQARSGTYHLDGLLEGPLDGDPALPRMLADWVRVAAKAGYGFSLDEEGGAFSLLADNEPREVPGGDADMAEPLRDLLEQLVGSFPEGLRPRLFSTVRSVQYGDGVEIQTVYAVQPDGGVEAKQREVAANTAGTPEALSTKERLKLVGVSLAVVLALFGLSSLFIDWGEMFSKAWRKVTPVAADEIATETGPFEPYLVVEGIEAHASTLHLTLARTPAFPTSLAQVAARLQQGGTYEEQEALRALGAGYVRLEAFDADGKHQQTVFVRVAGLREAETTVVKLGIRRETPPARLRLTW